MAESSGEGSLATSGDRRLAEPIGRLTPVPCRLKTWRAMLISLLTFDWDVGCTSLRLYSEQANPNPAQDHSQARTHPGITSLLPMPSPGACHGQWRGPSRLETCRGERVSQKRGGLLLKPVCPSPMGKLRLQAGHLLLCVCIGHFAAGWMRRMMRFSTRPRGW